VYQTVVFEKDDMNIVPGFDECTFDGEEHAAVQHAEMVLRFRDHMDNISSDEKAEPKEDT
jgi:hypothetical protein